MNKASAAKLRVLFLCTGNSCRSQMAEGWARYPHYRRVRDEIRTFIETLPEGFQNLEEKGL